MTRALELAARVTSMLLLCVSVLFAQVAAAHEVRPALLQVSEVSPSRFAVVWTVPQLGDRVLALHPVWPTGCREAGPAKRELTGRAAVERRVVECPHALAHQRIEIDGLTLTMTDVLVRIEWLDARVQTTLVKPAAPFVVVQARQEPAEVARGYFSLGVEHIALGVDHLLFVLGLLMLVRSVPLLVKTVTAFTLAHSLTLALATLGAVHVPQAPVEACIALSIAFVAREIARGSAYPVSLAVRYPWVMAFAFGLLHGFGFAGALSEVGLPQLDIPLALLMFNLGVECGQLIFIAVVLAFAALAGRFAGQLSARLERVSANAIGAVAMFWLLQRVAAF